MATKWQNIQYQLDAWCKEYGINPNLVIFKGWKDLGGSTMGLHQPYVGWSAIWLDDKWQDRKLGWLEMSVLWHEYCHAECYLEDMELNGHDDVFQAKKRRKINYWIGDYITKFLCPFL